MQNVKLGKAKKALAKRDYESAGGLFEDIVVADPHAHAGWFGLAEVALAIGQLDTAVQFLEHAVQLAPAESEYLHRLGDLYVRIGLHQEAIEVLKHAQLRARSKLGVMCSLSGAYVASGKWLEARALLQEMVCLPGAGAPHHCLLGLALQKVGELDEAMYAFQRATRLNPSYPDAWLSLGHLYLQNSSHDGVEACLQRLFSLAAGAATTFNLAGELALKRGDFTQAANFFRKGLEGAADSAELQAKLGLALVQGGDALEAIEVLQKAHEMGVAEDWILEHLGLMFTTRGQMDVARENLEMAVARQPDNLNAWNTLIVVYTKLGESQLAKQAAETILGKDPEHVNALLNLGNWYSDQARAEEALLMFRKALIIDPKKMIGYTNSLWAMVHSSEQTAGEVLALAREFDRNLCRNLDRKDSFADRNRESSRPLRVGWLTSDLRSHPVAAFVVPFLGELNKSQIESVVYSNAMSADETTRLAKGL